MAKYEDQVARMNFLMEYRNPVKESHSNIEFCATGADGKVYGILKEGVKYYIKQTESGKENIAESYDYIGGFTNKRANEFTDYNKATKQLELKLMSLNEAYGKKADVSTVDFKRSEKVFENLTEEARREIDRMNKYLKINRYRWDADAKALIKLSPEPELGEDYYYMRFDLVTDKLATRFNEGEELDQKNIEAKNYFFDYDFVMNAINKINDTINSFLKAKIK